MEENKRKAIILTFIGALTLLFVVVGGTFAYFQIVNTGEGETKSTLTGETEGLTKYGTPTLTQGTNKLHINLKASDMAVSKSGTEYWATNVEEKDYETGKQQHIISTAGISGAESEDTELTCTSELTIKASGSILEDTNPLVEKDGYVYLGSKNGGSNKVVINPTQIDLKQIIDKSMGEEGLGYQTEISYTIKGNSSIDITVDIDIINRDANQNSLAGKSINFTITNKNISCSVKEKEDKAYMKVLTTYNEDAEDDNYYTYTIDEEYRNRIEKAQFVNNVPSEEELNSKEKYWDLTDIELSPEKSVIGWIEKSGNKGQIMDENYEPQDVDLYNLYIGSESEIYAKDLSNAFYFMNNLKEINFENLNTSETTNMSNMFKHCLNLTTLNLSGFDTSSVTNMSGMFHNCSTLNTLDLKKFDTSNVIDMSAMFSAEVPWTMRLENIVGLESFVTTKVTNMASMFDGNNKISTLDLSSFDTSQVTNMSNMFYRCGNLSTLNLSNFTFDNVESYNDMFSGSGDFIGVPFSCQVKIKSSQQAIFESKFPLNGTAGQGGRKFTPTYVD